MDQINHDDLEDWAYRAMQTLQDIVDGAQQDAGNPDGDDECRDIRALMGEFERIRQGQPLWQVTLMAGELERDDTPIQAIYEPPGRLPRETYDGDED